MSTTHINQLPGTAIEKLRETVKYEGPRFAVKSGDFKRGNVIVTREWIEPGDAVAVLPYSIKDNYFIMARQPREVVGRYTLSLCAGKIDGSESPGEAAIRELNEELGFRTNVDDLEHVGTFYSSEGITNEKTHIFLVADPSIDPSADIDVEEAVTAEAYPLTEIDYLLSLIDNAKAAIAVRELKLRLAAKT